MTTQQHNAPVRESRTDAVVSALVQHRLLAPEHRDDALRVVDRVLGSQASAAPAKRRLAEIVGYLGGAFVVSAAGVFFAAQWGSLGDGQRVALLAVVTVVLAAVGLVVAALDGGVAALRAGGSPTHRRLAGVLLTGAAYAGGAAVGVQTWRVLSTDDSAPLLAGFATVALLCVVGYLVAPTVVGQLGVAVGLFLTVPWVLDVVGDIEPVAYGLVVLALGVGWLVVAELGAWRETGTARIVGCALAVVGAQIPVFDHPSRWVGYAALAVVAGAAFVTYLQRPSWPYLATGVVGVTLAVPQALLDLTDDALGPAGILLATGLTLLGASLLGLRLRQEVSDSTA